MYQSKVFFKNDFFIKTHPTLYQVSHKKNLLVTKPITLAYNKHCQQRAYCLATQTTCADAVIVPHNVTFLGSHCELWSCWSPPHTNCNNLALPGAPYGKPAIR